ncbi:diguanylate cyclase [Anaerosalibacter sp. Marseille-P3206]|uniref:diguanylate cyclase n=1 Tax=Anaerosalibacter sp. Marseille-P3206 TaxID=1871005 RepID=UPI000987D004|nr:diguanylate cyclase [Anaerosalibacter sp. Marseille-P3206]
MKIIDNRYKIDKIISEDPNGIVYIATDLWNKDKKLFLKTFNHNKHISQIDYFISEFVTISNIKHEYLLASEEFNIIKSIDQEITHINQYYYVTEYVDKPKLKDIYEYLNLTQRVTIVQQLCTVLDFLHYRGFVYKHLTPKDIYIFDNNIIKIKDLATVNDKFMCSDYDLIDRHFIAPEVILNKNNIDFRADFYSLGITMKYLFLEDEKLLSSLNNTQINFLEDTVKALTMKNASNRDGELSSIISDINKYFSLDYTVDYKKEREYLNFNTKIVGREKEIDKLIHIDNSISKKSQTITSLLVEGEVGVGKTRFLNEIARIIEYRGREVYQIELNSKRNASFKSITDILKKIIKKAPKFLVQKYGSELVKIIPELNHVEGIKPSANLVKEKEMLRMYDRISNFIIDLSKLKPIYILIDNFNYADDDTLKLINYLLQNNKNARLLLILSYNKDFLEEELSKYLIDDWLSKDYVEQIKLSKLNLEEIGEMVKNILGMNFRPLKFSTVLLKEALGNPRYIELLLQELYTIGELSIKDKIWHLMTMSYKDIFMPSNLDDTLRNQLKRLEDELLQLIKIISIFNSPVSKSILLKMIDIDMDRLNEIIEKLISMRLLDERVGDWGYSYTIYNMQLKKLVYYELKDEEKEKLHSQAAIVLEELYNVLNGGNIEELIYQLSLSNQKNKVVDYLIRQAKKMGPALSAQSIYMWEKAYSLMDDANSELKIEVLLNIGKANQTIGNNDKALEIYDKVLKKSLKYGYKKYAVKSKNYSGEIFLRRNDIDKAEKVALDAMALAEEINFIDGILKAKTLLIKAYSTKDEIIKALYESNKALELIKAHDKVEFLGTIYNQMGILFYFKGDMESAKDFYEKSIESYQKVGNDIESSKPLNNLGNIYNEYYGDKVKSMEYYDIGLQICNKYNNLDMELVFLNNIGETYIENHDYEKAKDYIEKARNIALEIEDKRMLFLANINLGQIYLKIGEFDHAFNCYNLTKEEYEKGFSLSKELICQYYDFLGNFYFKFGKWEEAIKYYTLERDITKNFQASSYLISKSRIIVSKYLNENHLDKEAMEAIRNHYRKSNLTNDREKVLTEFAFIAFLNGEYEYVQDFLKEIEELSDLSYSKFLDFLQKLLKFSLKNDSSSLNLLLDLEEKSKTVNLYEINLYINIVIGNEFYSRKDYYQAINYYLESLDMMYRLIKKIPLEELQISYVKSHQGDRIKIQINKILKNLFNLDVNCVFIEDVIDGKSDLENYFDFKNLLDLIGNENFIRIIRNSKTNNYAENINNMTDLISKFSDDYEYNLDLILKYIAKETMAQKGIICYFDEENDKLQPIARLNVEDCSFIKESIINIVNKREDGVIIKNSFVNHKNGVFEELLPIDTKALICMPIMRPDSVNKTKLMERRKNAYIRENKIIGYIYLETDRIFNRIDYERFKIIKTISYLAFLNIDNYRLKSVSSIDKMTGTYTRKYFDIIFNILLEDLKKKNGTFSLLMIDIDKFKDVNDTYGHRKGDEVLSLIGQTLIENTRCTDVVARYGGEEFIIVLLNTKEKEAIEIAEKIRCFIQKLDFPGIDNPLTISIGISIYPKHGEFSSELIEKADQALYCAKERGRNEVILWESNIANNIKRGDRLAGIISGNTVQDQRNVLAIMDIIDLYNKDLNKNEKIYEFLGRIIEIVDAEYGMLILIDEENEYYSRQRFISGWIENVKYNQKIINRAIKNKKGEFLIDWDNINDIDILSGTPNWQSIIVIPLVKSDIVKGVVYLSVPIKEKEFDYNCYNLVNTICGVFLPVI